MIARFLTALVEGFQSPSGVLGVCRSKNQYLFALIKFKFQSPSGVLGVCREATTIEALAAISQVSVPFRGFRGLQGRCRNYIVTMPLPVSVPFRGFRGLQGGRPHPPSFGQPDGFSPLPGF